VEPSSGAAQVYGTGVGSSLGGGGRDPANLGDILERVLDKGLVIAGDIRVNLLDIELLTIKLRLVIASLDTAREVGINWWESDPWLSGDASGRELQEENRRLRQRVRALESGKAMVAEPLGVWVYAVAERVGYSRLGELAGVGGSQVRALGVAELTAVASDVPLAEYGESALRRNLEDLAWLEATAREHHQVIDAVAQEGPVVPMRLATVYRNDASAAAMLAERDADFRTALRRITARKEWGVKAYAARPTEPAGTPAPAQRTAGAEPPAGSGAAYLRRRRDQLSASKNARREAVASAQAVHDALGRLAAETRLHPPQSAQLTGNKAHMVLNAAYLLEEQQADDFPVAVGHAGGAASSRPARADRALAPVLVRRSGRGRRAMSVSPMDEPVRVPAVAGERGPEYGSAVRQERIALVDLLDRVLAGGVVVVGEVTLSIADVDMVTISLRALVTSVSALAEHGADLEELNR
jgi:hypothetical protein